MMSSHTLKSIKLIHSKAIKKGTSYKNVGVLSDELSKKQKKGKEYRFFGTGRFKNDEVLDKTIHAYRIWFLMLKLALELEEQNATLIMKNEQFRYYTSFAGFREHKVKEKVSDRVTKKIKVKKSKYKDWDLDAVLSKSFDEWFATHSHLFSDLICKELSAKYEHYEWGRDRISSDRRHLSLQIDTSLKMTDILKVVTSRIKERKKENKDLVVKKKRKYSVSGSIHRDALLSKYNALILKLENTLSNEEILTHKDGYIRHNYEVSYNKNGNEDYARPIYGLLNGNGTTLGAKQLLVNVCNGFFMKQDN